MTTQNGSVWTAPAVERVSEPQVGDERAVLAGYLDWHRQTLLHKCTGLTAEQLKRAVVEPSNLTLLGLVRHMAEVERWWFRRQAAQLDLPDIFCTEEIPDGDFDLIADADAERDFATFVEECQLATQAMAQRSLDDLFRHTGREKDISVRWVFAHMIEEYARHNGHADLLRERIDGVTGD
jgi:uncharacterized damage-inducible protein DinB